MQPSDNLIQQTQENKTGTLYHAHTVHKGQYIGLKTELGEDPLVVVGDCLSTVVGFIRGKPGVRKIEII